MRASSALGMSVEESHRNLQLLRDAKKALNADLKDKRAASAVSLFSSIISIYIKKIFIRIITLFI